MVLRPDQIGVEDLLVWNDRDGEERQEQEERDNGQFVATVSFAFSDWSTFSTTGESGGRYFRPIK